MGDASDSPFSTGLQGRCPVCKEGALFDGFLKFASRCEGCGADFSIENAGDGPSVFVIFIIGIFIIPMALGFHMILNAPMWLTFLIWMPIIVIASLILLRLLRGVMFNLQWKHGAGEMRNQDLKARSKDGQ